jgi:F0F1-type ATP synthase membrane subunit c/vacuolar-type H+-ATPase subunit K
MKTKNIRISETAYKRLKARSWKERKPLMPLSLVERSIKPFLPSALCIGGVEVVVVVPFWQAALAQGMAAAHGVVALSRLAKVAKTFRATSLLRMALTLRVGTRFFYSCYRPTFSAASLFGGCHRSMRL